MSVKDVHDKISLVWIARNPESEEKAMADAVGAAAALDTGENLTSRPTRQAFSLLLMILPGLKDPTFGVKGGEWHTNVPEKSKALDKPAPATPTATVAGDFYTKLGVSRDATKEEIDQAYKNWAKENHPDVLRSKNADPMEIAKAEENAILMGEAYNTLKSPRFKADYDKFWDETFSGKKSTQSAKETPFLEETVGASSSYINITATPTSKTKPSEASLKETRSFQEMVKMEGANGVSPWLVSELRLSGLLPEGFSESQLISASHLYSRGITSGGLLSAIEDSEFLTLGEVDEIGKTALFMEYMEASESAQIPNSKIIGQAMGDPSVSVEPGQSPTQISFARKGDGGLNFVFDKASGFLKGQGEKIAGKTAIGKALKEGGKKVLEQGSKVLAKTGIKLAGKAALSTFFESLNAIAPGLGTALDVLINYLGPLIIGAAKAFFKSLSDPETLAKIMLLGSPLFFATGLPVLGSISLGGGLFKHLKNRGGGSFVRGIGGVFSSVGAAIAAAVVVAIGAPIFIALVAIPLTVAFILFIINSGAYVVPPFPPNTNSTLAFSNQYMDVKKTLRPLDTSKCQSADNSESYVKCTNSDLVVEIEYTVTITAKRGPLVDVTINDECNVSSETSSIAGCPNISNLQAGPGISPTSFPFSPPGNSVSPTGPFTFTYVRRFDPALTYYDSIVFDTITVSGTSSDGTNENVSSSASVCFGACPAGCFEISDAKQPWSSQPEYRDNVQQAINTLVTQYQGFTRKACSNGQEIPICYGGPSPDLRWGDHFGHGSSCDITLYKNPDGTPNNFTDVLYVLTHEIGHHIIHVASGYFLQYKSYPGIASELALCNNSVSTDPSDIFGFCDSTALYISGLPMTRFRSCSSSQTIQGVYPNHSSFVENVMLR